MCAELPWQFVESLRPFSLVRKRSDAIVCDRVCVRALVQNGDEIQRALVGIHQRSTQLGVDVVARTKMTTMRLCTLTLAILGSACPDMLSARYNTTSTKMVVGLNAPAEVAACDRVLRALDAAVRAAHKVVPTRAHAITATCALASLLTLCAALLPSHAWQYAEFAEVGVARVWRFVCACVRSL
jgi:hypothetical protein